MISVTTRPGELGVPRWSSLDKGGGELGFEEEMVGEVVAYVPGLPESSHVAGYVARDAEV